MEHTVGVLFDYYDDDAYLYALEKLVMACLKSEVGTRIIEHERPPIGSRHKIYVDFKIRYEVE